MLTTEYSSKKRGGGKARIQRRKKEIKDAELE